MKKHIITFSLLLASYVSFGQNWVPVGSGVSNSVNVMDSAKGLLYIGGAFDTAGGTVVNHITAWNGSSYSALGGGLAGGAYFYVNAITEYKGNIIVGGYFTSAGGIAVNNIAMWNGSSWSALGTGVTGINASVNSLVVFNNNLYVGGYFDSAGGVPAQNIAQWNGTSWSAVGAGISFSVNSMAVYNSNLYAGGIGGSSNGVAELSKWNGTVWDSIGGIYSNQSGCNITNEINVLVVGNGLLYIAGTLNDSAMKHGDFATWNGINLNWNIGHANFAYYGIDFNSMFVYNGFVIGGNTNIFYYSDTTFNPIGNGIGFCDNATCNACGGQVPWSVVFAIAGYKGKLYAGGTFSKAYSNQANYLEMFSGIVGINEVKETNTITVYPNPSNGVFTIEEKGARSKEQVDVYNMLGEKVLSQYAILTTQYSIDLSNQPSGVYLYRITNTDGSLVSSGKLIKE